MLNIVEREYMWYWGKQEENNGNTVLFIYYLQSQKQEIYFSPAALR